MAEMGSLEGEAERCPECHRFLDGEADPRRLESISTSMPQAMQEWLAREGKDRCPHCNVTLPRGPNFLIRSLGILPRRSEILVRNDFTSDARIELELANCEGTESIVGEAGGLRSIVDRHVLIAAKYIAPLLLEYASVVSNEAAFEWAAKHFMEPWGNLLQVMRLAEIDLEHYKSLFVTSSPGLFSESSVDYMFSALSGAHYEIIRVIPPETMKLQDSTFEEQVQRLAPMGSVNPETLARLYGDVEYMYDNSAPPIIQYLTHALYALACLSCPSVLDDDGQRDGFVFRWAELYVAFELELIPRGGKIAERLQIDPTVVGATVDYKSLWDVAARRVSSREASPTGKPMPSFKKAEELQIIFERLGYANLLPEVIRDGIRPRMTKISVDSIRQHLLETPIEEGSSGDGFFPDLCRMAFRGLVEAERLDDMDRLVDLLANDMREAPKTWARVLGRYGEVCKDAGLPDRFLRRVGRKPTAGETALPDLLAFEIGLERSNSLRLRGLDKLALRELERIGGLDVPPNIRESIEFNRAILLRTTGRPDASIEILRRLLVDATGHDRVLLLDSLAHSYGDTGQWAEQDKVNSELASWAESPWRNERWRADLAPYAGGVDGSIKNLVDQGVPRDRDALIAIAGHWATILVWMPEKADSLPASLVPRLLGEILKSLEEGNVLFALGFMRVVSHIADGMASSEARDYWHREVELREKLDLPDPLALAGAARHAFQDQDAAVGLDLLTRIPRAQSGRRGGIHEIEAAINSNVILQVLLQQIADIVKNDLLSDRGSWDVVRLVAELQRDSLGRASMMSTADGRPGGLDISLREGLGANRLAVLRPPVGALHVIEWLDSPNTYAGFRTTIRQDGSVESRFLTVAEDLDLADTARRLKARLNGWLPDKSGSPLNYGPWTTIETWIRSQLADVEPGEQVVFIDHEQHSGLPWHAVRSIQWFPSYSAGWTSLLSAMRAEHPQSPTIGVIAVPSAEDSQATSEKFYEVASEIEQLAISVGGGFYSAIGAAADADAVAKVLERSDIALVLTHGFVSPTETEVALMIAAGGELPTTHAISANSERGRMHRWSWREAARLARSPRLVLSAACSTGTSHVVGLGEHLGLYGALRTRGTGTVVAPLWDVVPNDSCALMVAIIQAHVKDGQSVSSSLAVACSGLEASGTPKWRAYSLGLEGDWR